MAKCKWCHESGPVNSFGYCDSCNDEIRQTIISNKNRLNELAAAANPEMSGDEKKKILDEVIQRRNALMVYKEKGVPFFKSDVDSMCETVYAKMGIPFQFQRTPKPEKSSSALKGFLSCVAIALVLFSVKGYLDKDREVDNLIQQLDYANSVIDTQSAQIEELQSTLDALKTPDVPVRRTFTLSNGNYISGSDFAAGTYDIKAVSGGGNVYSDNAFSGGINAIMGTEGDPTFYQREYKNISLPEGTTLTISDVKVKLTLVD